MFFKNKRAPEDISRTEPGFEEGEHRTPKTGIVLLILMFIAGLFFGWRALDDLARVPPQPAPLSYCSDMYRTPSSYDTTTIVSPPPTVPKVAPVGMAPNGTVEPQCQWSDLEVSHGIPALDAKRRDILNAIQATIGPDQQDLDRARATREQLESEYNLKLQEIQSNVPNQKSPDIGALQQQVDAARQEEARLQALVDAEISAARTKSAELKAIDQQLQNAYQPVFAEQNGRLRWYEFMVFLLQFVFVLPLFLLALRSYTRQLKRNSPYAVISTAIVAVAGVLLLRILLMWFWDLFLARFIDVLWHWIQNFEILRSIVFYLGMVLSFAIFGGAVYYLQKRIFDPRRVSIRRFRQNQCPQCQTSLDLADLFCPNCGHHIREQCASCGQLRFRELPHCPHCGLKK